MPKISTIDSDAWLAALVESSSDAITSKSLEGIVTSWNASAERIFGYSASEMVGQSMVEKLLAGKRQVSGAERGAPNGYNGVETCRSPTRPISDTSDHSVNRQ